MGLFRSIVCECSFCGFQEILTQSKTIKQAKEKLKKWGWINSGNNYFCGKDCKHCFDTETHP